MPALAFDRAFYPEHVHEAHYHLKQAFDLLDKQHDDKFFNKVRTALQRLQRFAEYPGWSVVHDLLQSGNTAKDAYEIAVDLLEDSKAAAVCPHPVSLLNTARAAEQWWNELRQTRPQFNNPQELTRLTDEIENLFKQAEVACDIPERRTEMGYNKLHVVSQHAMFLEKYKKHLPWDVFSKVEDLRNQAWKLIDEGVDGSAAKGDWYEFEGDKLEDHKEAQKAYLFGVRWAPEWRQLWVKCIGCSKLASAVGPAVPEQSTAEVILKKAVVGLLRDKRGRAGPWVKERWKSGIAEFQKLYGPVPSLRNDFARYTRELNNWR